MEAAVAELTWAPIISTIVYSFIGVFVFIVAYFIFDMLTPFSFHKEIEEHKNVSVGILIGSLFIAIAIIIAAAIR